MSFFSVVELVSFAFRHFVVSVLCGMLTEKSIANIFSLNLLVSFAGRVYTALTNYCLVLLSLVRSVECNIHYISAK